MKKTRRPPLFGINHWNESAVIRKVESIVGKPTTTEIVYRHDDGTEEVKYRRPFGSMEAHELIKEVHGKINYFYRNI